MSETATRENGHLAVAGIRILTHRASHPPTVEELAGFLGWSFEWTGVLVNDLARHDIVMIVDHAFTRRVEVRDHLALESLPLEKDAATIDDELHEFQARKKAEEDKLDALFSGEAERRRKKRLEELEKGFFSPPKRRDPGGALFRDPDEDGD
jgi:hypothetical protein